VVKSFSPAITPATGNTTLNITIENPNNFPMENVNFVDVLDSKLMASSTGSFSACGGLVSVYSNEVRFSGGVIPAYESCRILVVLSGVGVGEASNVVTVRSSNTPDITSANVTVTLMGALVATKTFSPGTVPAGQNLTGTLVLENTNPQPVTGVTFSDTIPNATVTNLSPPGPGCPTITTLSMSNLQIPNNTICTYTFTVTPTAGVFGLVTNPTVTINTANAVNSTMQEVSFFIMRSPVVSKNYNVGSDIALNQQTNLTITLQNPNTRAMTGVSLTDLVPVGLSFFPGE
jgi:uncharacterized repeat protein (TIGR01451 family)